VRRSLAVAVARWLVIEALNRYGTSDRSVVGAERLSRMSQMDKAYNAGDVHPIYVKAFNSGDIEATVVCYEPGGCFVAKSGRVARGTAELREVYSITFENKPTIKVDIGKIIPAGEDLALIIGEWTSKSQTSAGEKVWSGTFTDIVRRQSDGTWKLVLDNPNGIEFLKKQSA
jgi:uncharacterized protein (TIGR02246 family)